MPMINLSVSSSMVSSHFFSLTEMENVLFVVVVAAAAVDSITTLTMLNHFLMVTLFCFFENFHHCRRHLHRLLLYKVIMTMTMMMMMMMIET